MTLKTIIPAALASTTLLFGAAQAAIVTGGQTVIDVEFDTDFDIEVRLAGGDDLDDLLRLDITGGDVDLDALTGQIEHATAAFEIAANSRFVSVTNLIIDFNQSVVFGDVQMGSIGEVLGTNIAMFDFDLGSIGDISELFDLDDPSLGLFVNVDFAAILVAAFAIDINIVGVLFGEAGSNPMTGVGGGEGDVIPLPGAAILFGTVVAGAAARRKLAA